MLEIKGKSNSAVVYSNELDPKAMSQIQSVCDQAALIR